VREPHEWDIVNLEDRGARLVPQDRIPEVMDELAAAKTPIVVHCKTGGRSREVVVVLREAGVRDVLNLEGGILRWQAEVDPSLPRY
jgi:rhodanese-related sulfurtransferase